MEVKSEKNNVKDKIKASSRRNIENWVRADSDSNDSEENNFNYTITKDLTSEMDRRRSTVNSKSHKSSRTPRSDLSNAKAAGISKITEKPENEETTIKDVAGSFGASAAPL